MTRVIHTGDTHIGYQQYNAPERRRDFLEAFRQVTADAIADDVDAVIHAGDLFHDRRPRLVDLQGTVDVLRRLADADIPFLAVVGNHEGKRDTQWLDLFADLGLARRLGPDPVVIDTVAFYGLDFVPRSRREELAYEFEPVPAVADHAILVSHGLFEPFAHADWDTETVLERSSVDFDALLLGDNHTPDTAVVDGTWVTYCGSTERASASERTARGYNIVTFADENESESDSDGDDSTGATDTVTISRRALEGTRRFVFVDVELSGEEGTAHVQERVREYDCDGAVVIVTVEGDGRPITPAAIEETAVESGALIARVNDRRERQPDDEEPSVQFADPDAAVTARIRELGLSRAALEIDGTVRDETLADSNVRETVERRVKTLLEDDRTAFTTAPEAESHSVSASPPDADADANASEQPAATSKTVADVLSSASADSSNGDDEDDTDTDGDNGDTDGDNGDTDGDTTETDEQKTPASTDKTHASLGDFL